MSHLDRLARRALCLHSEGAAAPLATHRTQAPAARKRGGGPAHFQPVNAMPLGRQPLPEGGEIDSLCRAAAGIIPLITSLISAHNGAHAYPTEGVRRAQKMEARSADHASPAAQLVEGYTYLGVMVLPDAGTNLFAVLFQSNTNLLNLSGTLICQSGEPLQESGTALSSELFSHLSRNHLGNSPMERPGIGKIEIHHRSIRKLSGIGARMLKLLMVDTQSFKICRVSLQGEHSHLNRCVCEASHLVCLEHVVILTPLTLQSRVCCLGSTHPNCNTYRSNTPNRLYPGRSIVARPRPVHHPEDQNRQYGTHNKQLEDIGQLKTDIKFAIHDWLLAISNYSSLPTVAPLVHGGAA